MSATKVTPNLFASEALEEPVCEVIAPEMNPEGGFVAIPIVAATGASVGGFTGDTVGLGVGSGEGEEGEQTTGSFLQTQHASCP